MDSDSARHSRAQEMMVPPPAHSILHAALGGLSTPEMLWEAGLQPIPCGDGCWRVSVADAEVHIFAASSCRDVLQKLDAGYFRLLLLDLRGPEPLEHREARGFSLLEQLDQSGDLETRYGFHRICALVGPGDNTRTDELIRQLGMFGVGGVLRQPSPDAPPFVRQALAWALQKIGSRHPGKRALCLAGGGITGIYYELGALKCLDDCLSGNAVNSFDMVFGISAGAVVGSLLASGYSVDEFMAALAGFRGGRLPALNLQLLRLTHLHMPGLLNATKRALETGGRMLWNLLRHGQTPWETLFLDYGRLFRPPFHSGTFERILRDALEKPGASNDFEDLPRPLYIGASDQDRRRHVLFGADGQKHVPISQAVQASLSFHPVFSSVPIEGRFFEDGAVTRTSNFVEAIRRGADLLFVLDPFVPYVSKDPGFAAAQGLFYNVDQNLRTISYTRFENTRNWVLRRHPEVSSYTFLPSNRLRRVLSVNPMDHRPFLEIWRGAYLSTLARIERISHRMRGDLAAHGIGLDTARATDVAARLRAQTRPGFSDFFPDGRVVLKQPPMARDLHRSTQLERNVIPTQLGSSGSVTMPECYDTVS